MPCDQFKIPAVNNTKPNFLDSDPTKLNSRKMLKTTTFFKKIEMEDNDAENPLSYSSQSKSKFQYSSPIYSSEFSFKNSFNTGISTSPVVSSPEMCYGVNSPSFHFLDISNSSKGKTQ